MGRTLTIACLVALVSGVVAGLLAPDSPGRALGFAVSVLDAVGEAWVRALRMVVLPLVVSLLVVALLGTRERAGLARMGAAAVAIFFVAYLFLALLSAVLYPPLIRLSGVARGAISTLRIDTEPVAGVAAGGGIGEWLLQIVPVNPFASLAEDNVLQVVVFSIVFAAAVGSLAPAARETILALFTPIAEAMLIIVEWLLWVSPLTIFALVFGAAREIGVGAAWMLVAFALITTAIMIVAILAFLPAVGILGRIGTGRFARAAWPGQVVALATRSSLATLPALVGTAKSRLGLPDRVVGFGLPFAASTFKPSNLISSPGRLLFLAWVYAIPVDPLGYAMFVGYVMLISTTVLGIPSQGSRLASLPAFAALGIPVEGIVLISSVEVLYDFAATVLNTTGYLGTACLLPRASGDPGFPAGRSPDTM
jgi:Na+/H+-dicarboxylate symporter